MIKHIPMRRVSVGFHTLFQVPSWKFCLFKKNIPAGFSFCGEPVLFLALYTFSFSIYMRLNDSSLILERAFRSSSSMHHAVRVGLKINEQQTMLWFILVLARGRGANVTVLSYISWSFIGNISTDLWEVGLTCHLTAPIKPWYYEPEGRLRAFNQFLSPMCLPRTQICSTSVRAVFVSPLFSAVVRVSDVSSC